VQDARANQPAGARLQAIGLGEVEDAVVALVPILDALADLGLGGAGFEAEEGMGEIVAYVVMLRREVVGLRFAFLADELGLLGILVHVQGNWSHVVEELRVHRPLAILLPDDLADDGGAAIRDRLPQREAFFADHAVAEALVGHAALVGRLGGGGEPALVNPAAVGAVGVGVVGMELDAQARLEEGARDPVGREAQQAAGVLQSGFNAGADVLRDGFELCDGVHRFEAKCAKWVKEVKCVTCLHCYICESAFIRCRGERWQIYARVASVR
jgi:hypothetical protein